MRERYELALKIACAVLAGVLLIQTGRVLFRGNPVKNLKIPALPVLAVASDSTTGGKPTNSVSVPANAKGKTNSASKGTNSAPDLATSKSGSNSVPDTNGIVSGKTGTNAVARAESAKGETNSIARLDSGKSGTNSVNRTNSTGQAKGPSSRPDMAMMGGGFPGRPGGKKGPDLPPAIQARVDKITDSEILGPVFHPLPMALLGIAGNVAILRSPSGQTGLVKEGDELGGLKLLRIGTNRVLVEQSGEKKELTIFSGYGSETLMPKEQGKTNETTSKHP